jgi:hypothetical protein
MAKYVSRITSFEPAKEKNVPMKRKIFLDVSFVTRAQKKWLAQLYTSVVTIFFLFLPVFISAWRERASAVADYILVVYSDVCKQANDRAGE